MISKRVWSNEHYSSELQMYTREKMHVKMLPRLHQVLHSKRDRVYMEHIGTCITLGGNATCQLLALVHEQQLKASILT